ncbi:MAG: hypothetical protein FDZ70_01025, partial [Actinobacteria bacterium]
MARNAQVSSGLAANLTMLTLAVVTGTLVLVGGAALSGVYGYTRRLADDRLKESSALVAAQLDALAQAACQSVERTSRSRTGSVDPAALVVDYTSGTDSIDRLVMLERAGRVVVSFPADETTPVPPEVAEAAARVTTSTVFASVGEPYRQVWV